MAAAKRNFGRPFTKKEPTPTAVVPADPPAQPRLFDPMTEDSWRANLDMVMWWRGVLGHPHGRALVELMRSRVPTALSGGSLVSDAEQATKLAALHKATEGAMLGMIAGYELLKDILLNRLTSHIAQPVRMRSPGQHVEPHAVTPPS